MNHHVEHPMFSMGAYHALPELHKEILCNCPPPYTGFFDAYREIVPTMLRQLKDPTYFVVRRLPDMARPAMALQGPAE